MDKIKKDTHKLSVRVEELWENVSPLELPEEEKLNACFEKLPVSLFPPIERGQVVELSSDTSLGDAILILAENKILSAPVRDVGAPEDASWIDKYLGVIEFANVVHWVLQQSELAGGVIASTVAVTPAHSDLGAVSALHGSFFEELTSSDMYRNTKVKDITGFFRWAPFVPVQNDDCLLTVLLLLSKYRIKSLPVVEPGEGKIENFITQSAIIHMLAECTGLPWFESLGKKSLSDIGLPKMKRDRIVKVDEEQTILEAFHLMRSKSVGGIPVVVKGGCHVVGNISMRDIQFLLICPEIYKKYSCVTVKIFLEAKKVFLESKSKDKDPPLISLVITCTKGEATKDVILKLHRHNIHRIYVVDDEGNLEGVVTMRDLISKFVMEPVDYFGEFFAGWAPSLPSPHSLPSPLLSA